MDLEPSSRAPAARSAGPNPDPVVRSSPPPPAPPLLLLAFAVVLVVAVVLRCREAAGTPLWFDEIYIVLVARRSILEMLHTVAADIHPPLQFLLRWLWIRIGGDGELWQKSLSIFFALASLIATYRLGRRMFGAAAGLFAVALLAVLPAHVHYSQEVEDYSLQWLLFVLAIDAAWAWIESRRPWQAVALVLWSSLALSNHYLAMFFLGVLAVWGALILRNDRAGLNRWLTIWAIVAVIDIPQFLVFFAQFRREGYGSFFRFPAPATLFALLRMMSFSALYMIPPFVVLSLLPLFRRGERRAAVLLWLLSTLPLFSTRAWVLILPREGLYAASLWMLLIAAGLVSLKPRVLVAALAAAFLAIGFRAYTKHQLWPEAVALSRVERQLRRRVAPGETIAHAETHSLLYFLYQWPESRNRLIIPEGRRVPYYDGGLAVPDSCYLTPAEWDAERRAGRRWWGVIVDRALATRGGVYRAGVEVVPPLLAAPHDSVWTVPPVTVIEGSKWPSPN